MLAFVSCGGGDRRRVPNATAFPKAASTQRQQSAQVTSVASKRALASVRSHPFASSGMTVPPPTRPGSYRNDGDKDHIGDADNDNGRDIDEDALLDYQRNDNNSYHDKDDLSVLSHYGPKAAPFDQRAITAVVQRYYAALSTNEGVLACKLLIKAISEPVPSNNHETGQRSSSCAGAVARLFERYRRQLASAITVTGVRVNSNRALAEIGSKTISASWILLEREDGVWKIGQAFGSALP